MIIDLLNEAYLLECDSNIPIRTSSLIGTPITGNKCVYAKFDNNINMGELWVITTPPNVTCSGYYVNKQTPKEPAFLFPYSCPDIPTSSGYYDVDFYNTSLVTLVSGVTCSGYYFSGGQEIHSDTFYLVDDSYTILLKVNTDGYINTYSQPNLFLGIEGYSGNQITIGYVETNGDYELTIGLTPSSGSGIDIYTTGIPFDIHTVNSISVRGDTGAKIRIGCNNNFIEIDKPVNFLGNVVKFWVGGKPNVGYFKGSITDGAVWVRYVINDIIEYYIDDCNSLFHYTQNYLSVITTSSGHKFEFPEHSYPAEVYITTHYSGAYTIDSVVLSTNDSEFILSSGVDNMFCGTVVRGLTDTKYEIELYNNSYNQSYGYIYAYDGDRCKALSVSSDGYNFEQNQISIPGDVSWDVGTYSSGFSSSIMPYSFVNSYVDTSNAVSIYDRYRRVVYVIKSNLFYMVDLRTNYTYTLDNPTFITGTPLFSQCVLIMSYDSKFVYCNYKSGLYAYDTVKDYWYMLVSFDSVSNVAISVTDGYILYSYLKNNVSKIFVFNTNTSSVALVKEVSSKVKIAISNYIFIYIGKFIFRYYIDTLTIKDISQTLTTDVDSIFSIVSSDNYVVILSDSDVKVLPCSDKCWGKEVQIKNVSCSWAMGYHVNYTVYVTYNINNELCFENVRYIKDIDNSVNVFKSYLNKISLNVDGSRQGEDLHKAVAFYNYIPTFYLGVKYSINNRIVYGFNRESVSGSIHSYFMSFDPVTDTYIKLSDINGSSIDVDKGVIVDTIYSVYYINLSQKHYYKYDKENNVWLSVTSPSCGNNISGCTITDGTYDFSNKVYIVGNSASFNQGNRDWRNYYAFYGYLDINLNKIFYIGTLRPLIGKGKNGTDDLTDTTQAGGETAFIDCNTLTNKIMVGWSHYISKSIYYLINTTASGTGCIFNELYSLYEFGCRIYLPMTNGISRNLMLEDYSYDNNTDTYSSDIPNRDAIYLNGWNDDYNTFSLGAYSNYNYSVNFRCKIRSTFESTDDTSHFFTDTGSNYDGCAVGVDDANIYVATRLGSDLYSVSVSMSSLGISVNDWVDIGYSFEKGTTSSGNLNLYVEGTKVGTCYIPSNFSYGGTKTIFNTISTNVLFGNGYNTYSPHYTTEFSFYPRILTDTEFGSISYTQTGKPLATIDIDFYDSSDYVPQYTYSYNGTAYYYNVYQKYVVHDQSRSTINFVGDRCLFSYNYTTGQWSGNAVVDYDNYCPYNLMRPVSITSYLDSEIDNDTVVVKSSSLPGGVARFVFDGYSYSTNIYVKSGAYVTPIVDTKQDSMFFYNVEYLAENESYIDVYVRYANTPPLDYAHMCYCDDSSTYREQSIATGKVFYSKTVTEKKSCAVYYNYEYYLVTIDGSVYKTGNYDQEIYNFTMLSFTLVGSGILNTWFSPDGNFILYWLSNKKIVAFPLGLGFPCSVLTVSFSDVKDVMWDINSNNFSLSTNLGVYTYNYKLGLVKSDSSSVYIFQLIGYTITIDKSGNVFYVSADGKTKLSADVTDIDISKRVVEDYTSYLIYYVSTYNSELKRFSVKYDTSNKVLNTYVEGTGLYSVSEIQDIGLTTITLDRNASLCVVTKNGVIVNDYGFINKQSGGLVYNRYNVTDKVSYYPLDYIYQNDLVWFDSLEWIPLVSKTAGVIRGSRYVQFKIVLSASTDATISPILDRIYVGGPVRVGPIAPYNSKVFYVRVSLPVDDSGDVFSTKLITYFETLLFEND